MKFPGKTGWLWLTLATVVLDQLSKHLIAAHMRLYDTLVFLPVFNISLLHNSGAAFSFLAGASGWQRWFFVVLALAVTVMIVYWLWRMPAKGDRWLAAGLALVAGGAIGNVTDRLMHGYVIDFVQVHYHGWYFPAFNVADSAITVGAALLLLDGLLKSRQKSARE
jgi:signal peptidase II